MISPPLSENLPYIETPLIHSLYLSELVGSNVMLKLEQVQPSGSFKSRGLGNLVYRTVTEAPLGTEFHFFSPSGGNAGCATAYAARKYKQKCTVCVPVSTNPSMVQRIAKTGATVVVHGEYISDSVKYIQQVLIPACKEQAIYCHPYDNKLVWDGNATIAKEIIQQCGNRRPDAIICSVGGGGLYNGLVQGLNEYGYKDIPIVAVETEGCAALNLSIKSGGKQVQLKTPKSIATSLSTANVTKETIQYAMKGGHPTHSIVVSDKDAAQACINFANDHKLLVEAACGTALAPIYCNLLPDLLIDLSPDSIIVVVVCGGNSVDYDILRGYSQTFGIPI